jgi:rhamnosyltransferase
MNKKIAGVITLYSPCKEVLDNVRTYIGDLDVLFVVDNSDNPNDILLNDLLKNEKTVCIHRSGNVGLAKALNLGAERALQLGYEYLFTIDQDSRADQGMIGSMIPYLSGDKVGIVSPRHILTGKSCAAPSSKHDSPFYVMTSGNILNLMAYNVCGPFCDQLFIDGVDQEYCLRLREKGYSIVQVNTACLFHNLGEVHAVLGLKMISHSPLRTYYISRNSLYIANRYENKFRAFCNHLHITLFKLFIKACVFEDFKILRLRMMWRAYTDYKNGILGKYSG